MTAARPFSRCARLVSKLVSKFATSISVLPELRESLHPGEEDDEAFAWEDDEDDENDNAEEHEEEQQPAGSEPVAAQAAASAAEGGDESAEGATYLTEVAIEEGGAGPWPPHRQTDRQDTFRSLRSSSQ